MKEKQLASLVLLDISVQKTQLTLTLSLVQRAIFAQMELSMQLNTLVPRATIMVPLIVSAWQTAELVLEGSTATDLGSLNLLDHVLRVISVSMLLGQTNPKIMTTLHLVIVSALQTLLEENVKRAFSALKDLMNLLPALEGFIVKVKERKMSLHSVILVGFVQVVQRSQGLLMEQLETFVQQESIVQGVLKLQGYVLKVHFQIILVIAMRITVPYVRKDHTAKLKD